jgi:hypothetical protein
VYVRGEVSGGGSALGLGRVFEMLVGGVGEGCEGKECGGVGVVGGGCNAEVRG